ncbi:MAG: NYN domain-containing protein [Patescibacteria group bacterium]
MKSRENNYAFIDSQNLYLAIRELGWTLDFQRFRIYLKEKYNVVKAYLFIGFMEENADLYKSLQEKGFILIFKPTLKYKDGHTKGNCDAELVLQAMIDFNEYKKAVIVTGDGDFHCLVDYLIKQGKLEKLFIPNQHSYSALLKRFPSGFLSFVSDLKKKLEYKKKRTP